MKTLGSTALALTALLTVAILVATLTPMKAPAIAGTNDKIHHMTAFAILVLPVALLRPRWLVVTAIFAAFLGGMIEIIQPYVGRDRSIWDWYADLCGIGIGSVIGLLLNRMLVARK